MQKRYLTVLLILISSMVSGYEGYMHRGYVHPGTKDSIPTLTAFDLNDFTRFKSGISPLINQMSTRRIVGLGEGTHGTSEFYKLRFWISRILIEDHGFTHVGFENDFGDLWQLNKALNDSSDLCGSMKNHLYSIWQRTEVLEFLQWLRSWNQNHRQKVMIAGLDYSLLEPDVKVLDEILADNKSWNQNQRDSILRTAAHLQDEIWKGRYKRDFRTDMNEARQSSRQGYLITDTLENILLKDSVSGSAATTTRLFLANLKQGFYPFYARGTETDRDSIMATNIAAHLAAPADKMIVWAHNAHLAKKPIYGGAVGGMGVFINRSFPGNYFVIGTGTADGSYSGTKEPRPTNHNKMEVFKLQKPIHGSWEQLFAKQSVRSGFLNVELLRDTQVNQRPLRFVGYGPDSGKASYDKSSLGDLFDAYIFIRTTTAAKEHGGVNCRD